MILINGVKVDAKDLPKLEKRAVFQLMGKYSRQEYDKKTRKYRTINAQSFVLPTAYTTFLEDREETVEIRYAKTVTPITTNDGKSINKYMPQHILFQKNGSLFVNTIDNDLYYFMNNCPKCDKGKGEGNPSFYLVNPQKNATNERENFKLEHDAVSMLIGSGKKSMYDQRRLVEAFNLSSDVDSETDEMVTTLLIKYAKADPRKFLSQISSAEINIKVCVALGKNKRIIEFETPTRKWKWGSAINSAVKDIVVVPISRNEDEYLIEWLLRTDNSGVLNEIEILTGENEKKNQVTPKAPVLPTQKVHVDDINRETGNIEKPMVHHFSKPSAITPELKVRAKTAGMPLQGTHNMSLETFMEKLTKAEDKKEKKQAV